MKPSTAATLALLRARPAGVTQLDALREIGSFRLGARVHELKQAGYRIEAQSVETYNGKRIAKYVLHEPRTLTDPVRRTILEEEMELGLV